MRSTGLVALLLRILLAVVVFAVFGEIMARALGILDRLNGVPRSLYVALPSPELPYRLRAGAQATIRNPSSGTFTVRVDTLGLRGGDTSAQPEPDVHRVLVLGDSVVYGDGVDEHDTFSVRLERELNAVAATRYEVLNGGVPAYDTAAEFAFFRDIGVDLAPRTVVLGVSLNDYSPVFGMTPSGFLSGGPDVRTRVPWLTNHSDFYVLLRWLVTYARGRHWWQQVAAQAQSRGERFEDAWRRVDDAIGVAHQRFYEAPGGPDWERVRRSLQQIRDLTRAHAMRFVVVIFPERYQVPNPGVGDARETASPAAQRAWLGLCGELGIECIDLRPAFLGARERPLFIDVQHPNGAGYAIAARNVAPVVRAGSNVPAS